MLPNKGFYQVLNKRYALATASTVVLSFISFSALYYIDNLLLSPFLSTWHEFDTSSASLLSGRAIVVRRLYGLPNRAH